MLCKSGVDPELESGEGIIQNWTLEGRVFFM